MVFFANSGIAWPRFEEKTRHAGASSLEAAGSLWKVFAALEGGRLEGLVTDELVEVANTLEVAATTYADVAVALKGVSVKGLTDREFELAGLPPRRYRYHEEIFWFWEVTDRRQLPIGHLYLELSRRLEILSRAVRGFEPMHERRDLAPQVFDMMAQWEMLAVLARIIAVLNRREASTGGSQSFSSSDERDI